MAVARNDMVVCVVNNTVNSLSYHKNQNHIMTKPWRSDPKTDLHPLLWLSEHL